MAIDKSFINVMVLSFGFMMVFAAFQTMSNIEVSLLRDRNTCDIRFFLLRSNTLFLRRDTGIRCKKYVSYCLIRIIPPY